MESTTDHKRGLGKRQPTLVYADSVRMSRVTKFISDHPRTVIIIMLTLFVCATLIVQTQDLTKISTQSPYDYSVTGNYEVEIAAAVSESENALAGDSTTKIRSFHNNILDLFIIFEFKGTEFFTVENLQKMKQVEEDYILNHPNYDSFCFAGFQTEENCDPSARTSLIKLLPENFTQNDVDTLKSELLEYRNSDDQSVRAITNQFIDKYFTDDNPKVKYARSIYTFGLPIVDPATGERYANGSDRRFEQSASWENEFLDAVAEDILDSSDDIFTIYPSGILANDFRLRQAADSDLIYSGGSIMFVFIYMSFHTKSAFIGLMGILNILMSFPFSIVIYQLVYGIEYFQAVHMMCIFIILGIGADDVFVFVDAYTQAEIYCPEFHSSSKDKLVMRKRLSWAYHRAVSAMFVTTFTTTGAFVATSLSPIIPIASFGVFAATVVMCNFALVISFFAASVVVYHRHVQPFFNKVKKLIRSCASCLKKLGHKANNNDIELSDNFDDKKPGNKDLSFDIVDETPEEKNLRRIEVYMSSTHADRLMKYNKLIFLIFVVWLCISGWYTSQMSPLTDNEQFFQDDHYVTKVNAITKHDFQVTIKDSLVQNAIMWGVLGMDTSDKDHFLPSDQGTVIWDYNFDPSPTVNQQYVYDFCQDLKENDLVFYGNVDCFIDYYKIWVESTGFEGKYVESLQQFVIDYRDINDYSRQVGVDPDGNLRYFRFVATCNLRYFQPSDISLPVYNGFEDIVKETKEVAPEGVENIIQSSGFFWTFIFTEKELVRSAATGAAYSMVFAFIVMSISTGNYIVAFYATIHIACIVCSVIMIMVLNEYELGVAESIVIVMLVGFAVDFVVHIGHAYTHSKYPIREVKTRDSLRVMGISILAGGITTLGASCFLFGATLYFFLKFGVVLVSTVMFSLACSLISMPAILSLIGPTESGSIAALRMRFCKVFSAKKENKEVN